jgi:hypothetical protein
MQTRSQTRNLENLSRQKGKYDVNIDFDWASAAWKANKKSIGNGSYRYVCEASTKSGKRCARKPSQGCQFCSSHC